MRLFDIYLPLYIILQFIDLVIILCKKDAQISYYTIY